MLIGYGMATSKDETDLSLRATIALSTIAEEMTCEEPHAVAQTHNRGRVHQFCAHGLWSNHKTLLWRLAIFVFFSILVTLLETLLPGKTGITSRVLESMVHSDVGNVTGE